MSKIKHFLGIFHFTQFFDITSKIIFFYRNTRKGGMALEHFRGTLKECLERFAKECVPRERAVGLLGKFTGASMHTSVPRWLYKKQTPIGSYWVKVAYFFEAAGYEVKELEGLSQHVRNYGRLLAYDVLTFEEATKASEYKSVTTLFVVLRGKSGVLSIRERRMAEVFAEKQEKLEEAVNAFKGILARMFAEGKTREDREEISGSLSGSDLEVFIHLVRAMTPLAERILSDRFSAEDRRKLRKLTGGNGIFQLSNLLNSLCSEKAREIISVRKNGDTSQEGGMNG